MPHHSENEQEQSYAVNGLPAGHLASVPASGGRKQTLMPDKVKHAELAQKALDAYLHEHSGIRRWCHPRASDVIGECDIIDLVTDLMLLAEAKGHDPHGVIRKVEAHLQAETGLSS